MSMPECFFVSMVGFSLAALVVIHTYQRLSLFKIK